MDQSSAIQIPRRNKAIVRSFPYREANLALASRDQRVPTPLIAGEFHDSLTGLPGLGYLPGVLRGLIGQARSSHQTLALVAFKIDDFRLVCEAYGRAEGNKLIKSVASILRAQTDPEAIIVRAGTNKFIVVLTGLAGAPDAIKPVQQILDAIAQPRDVAGQELRITASAGISSSPNDGDDYETLLRNCLAAMHESMSKGPGAMRTHTGNVALDAVRRLRLRADLGRAIENKGISLHYQPQFEVHGGHICGVEALARWFPEKGRAIEPRVFIPLAEQTGMIGALGAWVLQEACRTAARWHVAEESPPTLCVNVSTHQINDEMCAIIRRAIEEARLAPERLELEITEGSLQGNLEGVIDCLKQWKALGVRIALDDFGTGFSSLSHLSRLPVDRLKLDRSLIQGLAADTRNAAIVRSIIALGKELDISVIAEGVENKEQLQMLRDFGCTQVQGYLLARPAPAEDVESLLSSQWAIRKTRFEAVRAASQLRIAS